MGFTPVLSAFLAVFTILAFALALPVASYPSYSPDFCEVSGSGPYDGYSCFWGLGDYRAISCSCNNQPVGENDLCHFYTQSGYGGMEFNGYGQYDTCYNLEYLFWEGTSQSATLGKDAASCWLYDQPNCGGSYASVSANAPNLPPGISSFKCYGPVGYAVPSPQYTPQYGQPAPSSTPQSTSIPLPIYVPPSYTYKSSVAKDDGPSTPTSTPTISVPVYVSPPLSSSSNGGALVTQTPTTTTIPFPYVPAPTPESSSSKGGIITTSTPIGIPIPICVPPPYGYSSSSKAGGIVVTPTPIPSPIYVPPPYEYSSSSKAGGIVAMPTPTPTPISSPVYVPPPWEYSSSSTASGVVVTSTPAPILNPIYVPPPPPATVPYDGYYNNGYYGYE